jgi:hypothetical protein
MDKFKDRKPDRRKRTKLEPLGDTTYFAIPRGDKIVVSKDRRLSNRRNRKKIVGKTGDTIWAED